LLQLKKQLHSHGQYAAAVRRIAEAFELWQSKHAWRPVDVEHLQRKAREKRERAERRRLSEADRQATIQAERDSEEEELLQARNNYNEDEDELARLMRVERFDHERKEGESARAAADAEVAFANAALLDAAGALSDDDDEEEEAIEVTSRQEREFQVGLILLGLLLSCHC
jgi:hypothetical protein